jgi:hypothetical protein
MKLLSLTVVLVMVALGLPSPAVGFSVWLTTGPDGTEGGHVCPPDSNTCDIRIAWAVTPEEKYDKWKICWRESGMLLTDPCDENDKVRLVENDFFVIPDLKKGAKYRLRLEGRKEKNATWHCLSNATLENISFAPWLHNVFPCADFGILRK